MAKSHSTDENLTAERKLDAGIDILYIYLWMPATNRGNCSTHSQRTRINSDSEYNTPLTCAQHQVRCNVQWLAVKCSSMHCRQRTSLQPHRPPMQIWLLLLRRLLQHQRCRELTTCDCSVSGKRPVDRDERFPL
jgi:hypothetical protein